MEKMEKIINLTPHEITIMTEGGVLTHNPLSQGLKLLRPFEPLFYPIFKE